MLYNSKDYFTNRNAVLELRSRIFKETLSAKEAIAIGAKRSQLKKWADQGKLGIIKHKGINRYKSNQIKKLLIEGQSIPNTIW